MKKLMLNGGVLLVLLSTAACDSTKKSDDNADNTRVVRRDSVATEYEVTETVVEYDTTRRKKTVSAEADRNSRDNDVEVKRDRD